MDKMAVLRDVSVGYGHTVVVDGIKIEIGRGEILSLIGPNGAGKSTVLRSIAGQLALLGGSVEVCGEDLRAISEKERAQHMSIVLTERIHPELMTCREVVSAGRYPFTGRMGHLTDSDIQKVNRALELLKIEDLGERNFEEISDGQRQRVLLARAICQDPEVLLLDEPTSYLDIRYKYELLDILRQLSSQGVTVILSLHEIELALRVSTRVLCVRDARADYCASPGELLRSGRIRELFGLTPQMYEALLGGLRDIVDEKNEPETESCQTHYNYYCNRECEYYPCHKTSHPEEFNCLFCYCPLYMMGESCGGNFRINERGIKDCTECLLPHKRAGYQYINAKLKEWNRLRQKSDNERTC